MAELSLSAPNRLLAVLAGADARGRLAPDRRRIEENAALHAEIAAEHGCADEPFPFASDFARVRYFRDPENRRPADAPHDTLDPAFEVTVTCGLPGSGKSTIAAATGLPVVSLDAVRRGLGVTPDDNQGRAVQAAREMARRHLRAREPFVWDGMNLSRDLRGRTISLLLDYGARVRLVCAEAPHGVSAARNRARGRRRCRRRRWNACSAGGRPRPWRRRTRWRSATPEAPRARSALPFPPRGKDHESLGAATAARRASAARGPEVRPSPTRDESPFPTAVETCGPCPRVRSWPGKGKAKRMDTGNATGVTPTDILRSRVRYEATEATILVENAAERARALTSRLSRDTRELAREAFLPDAMRAVREELDAAKPTSWFHFMHQDLPFMEDVKPHDAAANAVRHALGEVFEAQRSAAHSARLMWEGVQRDLGPRFQGDPAGAARRFAAAMERRKPSGVIDRLRDPDAACAHATAQAEGEHWTRQARVVAAAVLRTPGSLDEEQVAATAERAASMMVAHATRRAAESEEGYDDLVTRVRRAEPRANRHDVEAAVRRTVVAATVTDGVSRLLHAIRRDAYGVQEAARAEAHGAWEDRLREMSDELRRRAAMVERCMDGLGQAAAAVADSATVRYGTRGDPGAPLREEIAALIAVRSPSAAAGIAAALPSLRTPPSGLGEAGEKAWEAAKEITLSPLVLSYAPRGAPAATAAFAHRPR